MKIITYKTGDGFSLKMKLYFPEYFAQGAQFPLIVFFLAEAGSGEIMISFGHRQNILPKKDSSQHARSTESGPSMIPHRLRPMRMR